MKADIDVTVSYPQPVQRVWAALTSSEALAAWLMPNDFQPLVGHRFTFRTKPAPGFDGIVRCEVLELDPPRRMVWSWAGGQIDTTVTFTLEETAGAGTRLRMRQVGFHGLGARLTRRILARGWPGILGQRLPAYLHQATAAHLSEIPSTRRNHPWHSRTSKWSRSRSATRSARRRSTSTSSASPRRWTPASAIRCAGSCCGLPAAGPASRW